MAGTSKEVEAVLFRLTDGMCEKQIMQDSRITVETQEDRATVTLNYPEKLNTITAEMFAQLDEIFADFARDETLSVVTVRGADGNFSAGVDMRGPPQWAQEKPLDVRDQLESMHETLRSIESLDAPVIAAIEGYALGGGLELTLACDIRISSATATFGVPEANSGLAMDFGGGQKLPGLIGEGMAKYLIMTGEFINADRAYEIGLVEKLVPESEFEETVGNLEDRLADQPTYVMGLAKRQIHAVRPPNLDEQMQHSIHHAIAAYHEEETHERLKEFLDGN